LKLTKEEELLVEIFEGPVRPLTEEDQRIQDEADQLYKERRCIRLEGYAKVLGVPLEQVEKMARENIVGLVTRVTNQRLLIAISGE